VDEESFGYAREVILASKDELVGDGRIPSMRGGETRVFVEDVLLDVASGTGTKVVVLFRDLVRPACVLRMRMEAVEPDGGSGPMSADSWAGAILANLPEAIEGGPGLRGGSGFASCDPDRIPVV